MKDSLVVEDLSKGAEAFKLRVVNQYNDEVIPKEFEYISAVEEVVVVLPKGGELLKMEPVKACRCKSTCTFECHYDYRIANMLRACKTQCACNSKANPCTVARFTRPSTRFQVFYTPDKGWALQTLEDIKPRQALFEYVGVLSVDQGQKPDNDDYIFAFDYGSNRYLLNAHSKGNLARFVNHSCRPNCCPMLVEASGGGGIPRVLIYSLQKIRAGEELVMEYGQDWWLTKADTVRGCCCKSERCDYDEKWCKKIVKDKGKIYYVAPNYGPTRGRREKKTIPRPSMATMGHVDLEYMLVGKDDAEEEEEEEEMNADEAEEDEEEVEEPPPKKKPHMGTNGTAVGDGNK